jgi:RNA-directed DNA polymerase
MNGCGKSDRPVVPAKPPNKTAVAETAEERGLAKGNADSETRPGLRAGQDAPNELDRVRRIAATDKEARFTALMHHVTGGRLREAYWASTPGPPRGWTG